MKAAWLCPMRKSRYWFDLQHSWPSVSLRYPKVSKNSHSTKELPSKTQLLQSDGQLSLPLIKSHTNPSLCPAKNYQYTALVSKGELLRRIPFSRGILKLKTANRDQSKTGTKPRAPIVRSRALPTFEAWGYRGTANLQLCNLYSLAQSLTGDKMLSYQNQTFLTILEVAAIL